MARINVNLIYGRMAEMEMNYTQLAAKSNISRASISTITHRGTCHPKNAAKIAKALDIPASELIID